MNRVPGPLPKKDQDLELIQAINAGRTDLFPELVKRYEKKVYNFGLRMCGDVRDTEDLVQETFINVFRYLKDFRYETQFKNWLYRIATSICIKKRRKKKHAPEREISLDELAAGEDQGRGPAEIMDWTSVPLDTLLNEELSQLLQEAIVALPKPYRLVLVLRDLEDFSTEETAQILNISPANVKVRLHRARLVLRDKLKDYFANDEGQPR